MFDVCIIGAGVIGCSIARELSRYSLKTVVLEKEADVSFGTTKGNSGVVHAGYDAKPGSLKSKFNILGNPLFTNLSNELSVPFKRNGTIIVALETDSISQLEELQKRGLQNRVNTEIITDRTRIKEMEPNLTSQTQAILFAPTGGIVSPYELTIGLAENASANGILFKFNFQVTEINIKENHFTIKAQNNEEIRSRIVINASGLYSDAIANMVGLADFTIHPRKGEYILLEKDCIEINHVLFPLPTKTSKGILVAPTMHGHPFLGPNAIDIVNKKDSDTTSIGLNEIITGGLRLVPNLPLRKSITTFAGLRAVSNTNDFIIGETKIENFINAAGIQSPGLTGAPAIAVHIIELIQKKFDIKANKNFNPIQKHSIVQFNQLNDEERDRFIQKDQNYANIVCRCELVTKAEVLKAVNNIQLLGGIPTLDGIKFRTRAKMGRCQGSFCTFRILKILEELGMNFREISKKGSSSYLLIGTTKDLRKRSENQ